MEALVTFFLASGPFGGLAVGLAACYLIYRHEAECRIDRREAKESMERLHSRISDIREDTVSLKTDFATMSGLMRIIERDVSQNDERIRDLEKS